MSATSKVYRIAVIGCGPRGTAAADAYQAHPRTTVVGLCDILPAPLATLADALGIAARFSEYETMIRKTQPDILVVATQSDLHYDQAMRVLEHGVNLDLEKPICLDLQEADTLLARSAAGRLRCTISGRWAPSCDHFFAWSAKAVSAACITWSLPAKATTVALA